MQINLDVILKKLMKIISENAGAEKGFFLMQKNGDWLIEAAYSADQNSVIVMESMPIIKADGLPILSVSILDYVVSTKNILVIDNTLNDTRFKDDLYIQIFKSKSLLCMPLLTQGSMIGIIYLENNLLTGSFTRERIDLLQLLSGHLAVSINNALLYENLDHKVQERTVELEIERNKLKEKNLTMEQDINLARKIQFNLIPQKIALNSISHIYKPMEALGGDFFDIIQFENFNKFGIFMSDVSGHGLTAAFITSMIKTIILQAGEKAMDPAGLLLHINEVLENMTSGNFVTVFYGIYDPEKRTLLYSNAGHNHPYLIDDNGIREISGGKSTAIAILRNDQLEDYKQSFRNCEEQLPIGAKLLVYTDGLTEVTPLGKVNFFEGDELNRHLMQNRNLPADQFTTALYSELVKFRGSESFNDDVCFLCIDIAETTIQKRSFKYKTEGREIRKACLQIESLFNDWGVDKTDIQDIVLAVDEALTNIKEHGYKEQIGTVVLEISKEKSKVNILIKDNAKPYHIDNVVAVDKSTYIDSDQIGGFGITIIKSLMESVRLTRKNNQNLLFMTKNVAI